MSSSLLSEPSTVKLLPRDRKPLTENWPAEPTPAPTPGPATLPNVCGGGATPGSSSANSSNVRTKVVAPTGSVTTSSSENEPLRRPSSRLMPAGMSVSSTPGAAVVDVVGVAMAGVPGGAGSNDTGTGTTSPV